MIIRFDASTVSGEQYHLPPEKLIQGNPRQTVWVHYTDPSGQFVSGVWLSEPGKWRVSYSEEEYCHLLEGHSVITEAGGEPVSVVAGDSFVIPRGFIGTWEVLERTRKEFAIYEASAAIGPP
ncbi:MAG: cupin domain-containing protein [Arenimonas sp.]|uniref:cupin domain-containing protein n=1 Tax=Arenimonas sp. TaxID=1872635 RepID=UPI0025BFFB2F|nr:cupin domain-containing protein [Arenimonas sp.]MBW8367029.1 cupin domain-containing protein [Arenimonas sp.]